MLGAARTVKFDKGLPAFRDSPLLLFLFLALKSNNPGQMASDTQVQAHEHSAPPVRQHMVIGDPLRSSVIFVSGAVVSLVCLHRTTHRTRDTMYESVPVV